MLVIWIGTSAWVTSPVTTGWAGACGAAATVWALLGSHLSRATKPPAAKAAAAITTRTVRFKVTTPDSVVCLHAYQGAILLDAHSFPRGRRHRGTARRSSVQAFPAWCRGRP